MKRLICALCVFLIGISTYVLAETKEVITHKNEYGGKTEKTVYAPADRENHKGGFAKIIVYFDSNGQEVKREAYFTDEYAGKRGKVKSIGYFNSDGMYKSEDYFTDEYAMKKGKAKTITYDDSDGKTVKSENYDRDGKLLSE